MASGGSFVAEGGQYQAGARVEAWLFSDPTYLGSANANSQGRVAMTLTIPAGVSAGSHELRLIGADAQGGTRVNAATIQVRAAGLPATGGRFRGNLLLALAVLTLGELLIGWSIRAESRRRG